MIGFMTSILLFSTIRNSIIEYHKNVGDNRISDKIMHNELEKEILRRIKWTMKNSSNRIDKVNEELKREIGIIIDQKLKNTNITGLVSVTKVKVSPDLKTARVYISILNAKSKKNTFEGIQKAAGFIRTELAQKVNLRYTPSLIFEIDDSIEYGDRIENILKEIMPNKAQQ